jgi:hypothetical protein
MRRDIETRFKPKPNSLASEILAVRVEKPIDGVVRALPNRTEWLRRVITEAAQRELMGGMANNHSERIAAQLLSQNPAEADQPTHKGKEGGDDDAK